MATSQRAQSEQDDVSLRSRGSDHAVFSGYFIWVIALTGIWFFILLRAVSKGISWLLSAL